MNYFTGKSILIISTESWTHIQISKHHYAKCLAAVGANVFFLNPPASANTLTKVEQNLTIVNYKTINGINTLPSFLRNLLNNHLIKKIKELCKIDFDIVWSFDPYRFQNLNLFNATLKIYHPVDLHNFKLEKEITETSDLILSVSDLLLKKYPSTKAHKINHGLSSHFIQDVKPITPHLPITVGYVGNLESKSLDTETLLRIVEINSNVEFLFIGPYNKTSSLTLFLQKKQNCKLAGQVPTEALPNYFSNIDIFLICYDAKMKINNSNNHKVLEFLSTGKPVVMNFTDEYSNKKDLVAMAENNDELPIIFNNVINDYAKFIEPEIVEKRVAFAQSSTYAAHVERIAMLAENIK